MDSRKPPAPRSFRKMVNVTVAIDHRKGKVKTHLQSVFWPVCGSDFPVRVSLNRESLRMICVVILKPEKERNYFFHGCENAWCQNDGIFIWIWTWNWYKLQYANEQSASSNKGELYLRHRCATQCRYGMSHTEWLMLTHGLIHTLWLINYERYFSWMLLHQIDFE